MPLEPSPRISAPLARNIRAMMERRSRELAAAPLGERVSARVAGFLGSMWSVATHAAIFGGWIVVNLGIVPGIPPWDPTLVVLAMIASVEAIFLTTFVLINQNRLARLEEDRAEMALQVALLGEQQASRLIEIATTIAESLGAPIPAPAEVEQLKDAVAPEAVLDEIQRRRPDDL